MASMYDPLRDLLGRQVANTIILTFEEIEKIMGESLPDSARKNKVNWWANSTNNRTQPLAWLNAGFRSATPDFKNGIVTFNK